MTPRDRLLDRVEAEVQAGRAWRAKEILRGALASGQADPAVLERYGRLLDAMGDRVEAGKYLLLSGARGPGCDEAIALFVSRHGRRKPADLVARFPAAVRRGSFAALPLRVQQDLAALGVRADAFARRPRVVNVGRPRTWRDSALAIVAIAAFVFFVVALVVGAIVTLSWVVRLF